VSKAVLGFVAENFDFLLVEKLALRKSFDIFVKIAYFFSG
jgi:hypothetical protein